MCVLRVHVALLHARDLACRRRYGAPSTTHVARVEDAWTATFLSRAPGRAPVPESPFSARDDDGTFTIVVGDALDARHGASSVGRASARLGGRNVIAATSAAS